MHLAFKDSKLAESLVIYQLPYFSILYQQFIINLFPNHFRPLGRVSYYNALSFNISHRYYLIIGRDQKGESEMKVSIRNIEGYWVLMFELNGSILNAYAYKRRIEAEATAATLMMVPDFIETPPIISVAV